MMKSSSMFSQPTFPMEPHMSTMKPMAAAMTPPIKALFMGMDDLMVRLSGTHTAKRM